MIYSTTDTIQPITITKATKSYKNCYFHKIKTSTTSRDSKESLLRLKTDRFELPYKYSDKFDKITITMPVDNPVYNSINAEVLKALKNIDINPTSLQFGKNGKIYLQITDRTQFFDHDRQSIDYEKGLEQLQRKAVIRCILTFNSICEFNGGFSYKVNVDQIQICDSGFSTENEQSSFGFSFAEPCQFSSDSEDNSDEWSN